MIAPRILLLLTLAAAFPKGHRYISRHYRPGSPLIPSPLSGTPLHSIQRWIPRARGVRCPFLQRQRATPTNLNENFSIEGVKGGTGGAYVVPATLVQPPSLYGQINSPRHQVIVLTGNNALSLGGSGSKDKKTKGGNTNVGNVNQVFFLANNELAIQHHDSKSKSHEHDLKTISIGGQAEILQPALGVELKGDVFGLKEVSKDTNLEAQDLLLVVQDDSEKDREIIETGLGKTAESDTLLLIDEAGSSSLDHKIEELGEDLTLVKDLPIMDVVSAAQLVETGLQVGEAVVDEAIEKTVLLPLQVSEIATDLLVGVESKGQEHDLDVSSSKKTELEVPSHENSAVQVIESGLVPSDNINIQSEVVKELELSEQEQAVEEELSPSISGTEAKRTESSIVVASDTVDKMVDLQLSTEDKIFDDSKDEVVKSVEVSVQDQAFEEELSLSDLQKEDVELVLQEPTVDNVEVLFTSVD